MFTGIVEEMGEVLAVAESAEVVVFTVRGRTVTADAGHGDSIAVNGVCLTAVGICGERLGADVMHETLRRSSLGDVQAGAAVNLELALRAADRLGGHVVQGHVDGVGVIAAVREDGFAQVLTVAAGPEVLRYIVEKGSIALDGVSLTVARIGPGDFDVSLVPETLRRTNLGAAADGDQVNIEVDVLAKYVERLVNA